MTRISSPLLETRAPRWEAAGEQPAPSRQEQMTAAPTVRPSLSVDAGGGAVVQRNPIKYLRNIYDAVSDPIAAGLKYSVNRYSQSHRNAVNHMLNMKEKFDPDGKKGTMKMVDFYDKKQKIIDFISRNHDNI